VAILKLTLSDFDEVYYRLIGIHSVQEDYRLAFLINQKLPITLSKSKQTVSIKTKEGEVFFSKFVYEANDMSPKWTLIQNINEIVMEKTNNQNLFENEILTIETKVFLLPEVKKVDYLLKIENIDSDFDVFEIIKTIKEIQSITAVYEIQNIKSKNNLIF
jgi:hypothetical protein